MTLGANAAMELGNSGKALKFYKTVLKYDPDQKEIKAQYRKLKGTTTTTVCFHTIGNLETMHD